MAESNNYCSGVNRDGLQRRRYKSQAKAKRRAVELRARLGPLRAYPCYFCNGWHLTSEPDNRKSPRPGPV